VPISVYQGLIGWIGFHKVIRVQTRELDRIDFFNELLRNDEPLKLRWIAGAITIYEDKGLRWRLDCLVLLRRT